MRYDVIIAGAGPAGSTAARECAARGLRVVLLDRAAFPRDKPCGGGVNVRAARMLPFDLAPVIERVAFGVRFSLRGERAFVRYAPRPITYVTQRRHLDAFLVARAAAAGAEVRERAPVRAVRHDAAGIIVDADGHTIEGRALVAADGVWGPTARLAGIAVPRRMGLALEAVVPWPDGLPTQWTRVVALDIANPPGGYGWVFPRGDHLNIGVGGFMEAAPDLRAHLTRLAVRCGLDPARLQGVRGYHLPVRVPGAPLAAGNVVLVGDAAGLLDPLTGEGIYAAIWSGVAAARHLAAYLLGAARDLQGYAREVEGAFAADLRVARRLHDIVHCAPGLFLGSLRYAPPAWGLVCRILRGDQSYAQAVRRVRWAARFFPRAADVQTKSSLARSSRPATTSHSPRYVTRT